MVINLLAGSKAEFFKYSRRIRKDMGKSSKRTYKPVDLYLFRPILFIAGTGHLTPHHEALVLLAQQREGVVHYYSSPGLLTMPSLEIAHEFAGYLGINPQWRYQCKE